MDKAAETYSTQMRSEHKKVNRKQKTPLSMDRIILKYILSLYHKILLLNQKYLLLNS
jgi:hypothetical protein